MTQFCIDDGTFSWPYASFQGWTPASWANVTFFQSPDLKSVYFTNIFRLPGNTFDIGVNVFDFKYGLITAVYSKDDKFDYPPFFRTNSLSFVNELGSRTYHVFS